MGVASDSHRISGLHEGLAGFSGGTGGDLHRDFRFKPRSESWQSGVAALVPVNNQNLLLPPHLPGSRSELRTARPPSPSTSDVPTEEAYLEP